MRGFGSLWSLPGPMAFLDRCVDALQEGASVVVAARRPPPTGLWPALGERCADRGMVGERRQVEIETAAPAIPPEARLAQHLLGADPTSDNFDVSRLAKLGAGLGAGIYWLNGVTAEERATWVQLLERLAHAARTRPAEARPRLVWLLPDSANLPRPDVGLRIIRWNHELTALDLRLFAVARIELRRQGPGALAARDLKATLAAEAAVWVPERAAQIVDCSLVDLLDPSKIAEGGGLSITEAGRLIWRAQLQTVYPLLEERRTQLVALHQDLLTLPWSDGKGAYLVKPLDHELAHLCQRLGRSGSALSRELTTLRNWRNALAHLEPLTIRDLSDTSTRLLLDPFAV